jgi:aquaglyceroporin related protein
MDDNPRAQNQGSLRSVTSRGTFRAPQDRDPRSEVDQRTPRPSVSHGPSVSRDRDGPDDSRHSERPSVSHDRSVSFEDSHHSHRHLSPHGVRYRASMLSMQSQSPGRARRNTLRPRRSVAVFTATGRDDDAASRNFSLSGPAPIETLAANQPYVDPGYSQLNPAYDQPANARPVWSLAKPLPRVLRPGMVPTKTEIKREILQKQNQEEEDTELDEGRIEPSLRFDKVTPQLNSVRQEREFQLFEAYKNGSVNLEPRMRRASELTGLFSPHGGGTIPEEEEGSQMNQSVSHLENALAQIEEAKANELPYEDAIPLMAYEASLDEVHNLHTYWSVIRLKFREPLAELLAVSLPSSSRETVLTYRNQITVQFTLGFSTNLAITVSKGRAGVGDTSDWGWGLATMIAIYIAGGISGAHLNPAMTLMLYIYRGFPLSRVPSYIAAQMLGVQTRHHRLGRTKPS